MNLLKLFRKEIKIARHGFTMVELSVVVALTGIITTFLLSMLIAVNSHMNNDLLSVSSTSELRNAQIFFENWVRYNDMEGVTFTAPEIDTASLAEPAGYQLMTQPTYNLVNLSSTNVIDWDNKTATYTGAGVASGEIATYNDTKTLKLNVLVTDSFTTFGYNGIIRAKGVMPYSLFGDFLLLYIPKVDSMMSEEMQIFISSVSCASSFRKYSSIFKPR